MNDTQPIVFVLDDEESVVVALARILHAEGFAVRTWTSVSEFLETYDPEVPGCLVTDVLMPTMSGLELQRALLDCGVERPIIFITGHGDIPTTVQGMKAGAISFLPKPVRRTELVAAVREAIARDATTRAAQHERQAVQRRIESLTRRERQVLELVTKGMLNKQIAAALGASEKTIKVHRGRLMEKMQVRSVAALVGTLARVSPSEPAMGVPFPTQVPLDQRI
ncbi:MAG TPA: response regulator [Steroidobacteraceae bacterium]|nr:response regulator [Steroidobacteraceae bacterium]